MYLTVTQTPTSPQRTTTTTRWTTRPTTQPASTTIRAADRKTTPDPLINAWTRRAMAANGFGGDGC